MPETDGVGLQIAKEIAGLHKRALGRGPTWSRAVVHDDRVVCLLSGALTRIEQTLRASGHRELIRRRRIGFEAGLRRQLIGAVERRTGRRVLSLMSAVDPDADLKVDVFVFEPGRPR